MNRDPNELDTYVIPPNFIEGGTVFGGLFKLRNVIEAGILALLVGVPVFLLDVSVTVKVLVLCLTALPLGFLALIGVSGESLSSYIFGFFKYVKNRRILGRPKTGGQTRRSHEE